MVALDEALGRAYAEDLAVHNNRPPAMTSIELIRTKIKARADTHADSGLLVSMADARRLVLEMFAQAELPCPSEEIDYLASEMVRLTLEAHDLRSSRLRLHRMG